jgi:dnd system-associated protein 4
MAKIRIEKDSHDLYKRLGRDDESSEGGETPFSTMKDVFMLCAVLGANKRVRTPLNSPREIFDENILKSADMTILRAIALSETGDINCLATDAEIYKIAQEFANTGVRIIRDGLEAKEPVQSVSLLVLGATK